MLVKDKVMVVTGGGNGMGREMVLLLLSKGASVAAVDLNKAYLDETAKLAGDNVARLSTHLVNIADQKAVAALPEKIIARHGQVDGIINNAGIIQPFVRLNDLQFEAIERVMNVNFYGALYMVKAFLPHLLQRPVAHITNISSMGGFLPVPGQTIYGASKAAVKLMTEGLYAELLSTNVRVTVVYPGAISTNITTNSGIKIDPAMAEKSTYKMLSAREAARIIIEAIEKDQYNVKVGSDSKMMDFFYRLNPKNAANLIYKQMKSLLNS